MRIKDVYIFAQKNLKENSFFLLALIGVLALFYQISDLSESNQVHLVSNEILYFQTKDEISLEISTPSESKRNFLSRLVFSAYASANGFEDDVEIYKVNGNIDYSDKVEWQYNGASELVLDPNSDLEPGLYKIKYLTRSGDVIEKTFAWGVLAFNSDKDWYLPGEQINLHYGVLDDSGNMVCNADLLLKVFNEEGELVAKQSTSDGTILVSDTCEEYRYVEAPDFSSHFVLDEAGQYKMELVAHTINGEYSKSSYINVVKENEEPTFTIRRTTATRIYPASTYPVSIQITPKEDFNGQIIEKVPESFEVELNLIREDYVSDSTVVTSPDFKEISWNVKLLAGQSYELFYTYDAPDISPEYYVIEPLEIFAGRDLIYKENRSWEIASDAIGAAYATRLWTNGFERNTTTAEQEYTANIGTTGSISTSTIRSGTYALRTNLGSAATSGMRYTFATADSATGTVVRAYIRVATLPSTEIQVLALRDASTYQASIRLDGSGNLKLWDEEDNAQVGSTLSSAISTNTWYRLELRYDFGTAATGDTDIAGSLDGNIFAVSTTQNHANGVRSVDAGILASATGDFYWDDMAINQDAFASQDNWVGEGKVVLLLPDGNGTNTTWTAGTGAGDYLEVDDPPSTGFDDITTYVTCAAGTEIDEYTLASSASAGIASTDRIRLVEAWSRARSSSATASGHTIGLYDGTNVEGTTSTAIASATWFTNDDTMPRNSEVAVYNDIGTANHGPITPSDVDGYQIRLSTADCSPAHQVSAVWALVEYVPTEGGRVWSSGFELNSGSTTKEWDSTAGTVSIDSTTKRSGAYSLRANSLASGTEESVTFTFVAANSDGPYYVRTYLYLATAPSADNRIIELQDSGSTARAYLELTSSGTLELYDEDGIVGSASSALSTGQWYRVELQFNSSGAGSTDTIEARIDGSNFATSSTRNLTNGVTKLILGGNLNGEAQTQGDWYFDDVAINNGTGVTQTGYPGSGKIVHLRPNAAGDNGAWAAGTGSFDYAELDEVDPDDVTTYIATSTVNLIEDVNLDASSTPGIPSDATVTLVSTGIRMRISAAATMALTLRLKDNAAAETMESNSVIGTSTTWFTNAASSPRLYPNTTYTAPFEPNVWTISDLDNMQIGVREIVDSSSNLNVSTLWALVEYVPATITIEGTCDAYDQTTDCGDTGEIKFAVNGNIKAQTQPTVAGTWTISGVEAPANGDVITVFIDGAGDSDEAVAVTKYDGSGNITGVKLFKEHLTIGNSDTQTITNANLSQYDNSVSGDEDIFYDISAGNDLTVDSTAQSSQEELYIVATSVYQPASGGGADVTTHDIEIDGTLTADSNALTVAGSWLNDSVFNSGSSTVTFTATSGTETLDSVNASAPAFNNIIFGSGSSSATWQLLSEFMANANLTISFGTLDTNGSEMVVKGNFDNNSVYVATSTLVFMGSGNSTLDTGCSSVSSCPNQDLYYLEINKDSIANEVTLVNSGVKVETNISLSQGTFIQGAYDVRADDANSVTVSANSIWSNTSTGDIILGGSFANSGSVILQGGGAACGDSDSISITSTGAQRSWTGSGTFAMNDLSVQDQGGSASITVYSGTSVSGNDTNWTFSDCPIEPAIGITQGAGTIEVNVPNRYKMIMNTGDTNDYMTWYDRYESDSSPDPTHEFQGPCVTETNVYCLRDDGNRKTTILEVTESRVRIEVSGKLNNEASTDYLDDESATPLDVAVVEQYTFTINGVYVKSSTDFRTTGVTLDADSAHNGYEWLGVSADVTDGAFNEGATPDIIYGDGATETNGSNQSDGAELANSNTYVVLPGTGSSTYQDAFVGIVRAGWYDDTSSATTHEWNWDEGFSGTQDMIAAQEQAYSSRGEHLSTWFFHLLPEAALDSEAEREGYINDQRNPDKLAFTTGSEWDDNSMISSGVDIDNSDDRLTYADSGSTPFDIAGSFTLEGWVKFDRLNTDFQVMMIKHATTGGTANYSFDTRGTTNQNELECGFNHGAGQHFAETTNSDLVVGEWYHLSCVHDASADTITIYVNGVAKDGQNTTATNTPTTGDEDFFIGDDSVGSWGADFEGKIDEVRVWNVARTQAQIIAGMNKEIDPSTSGLAAYYRMNENVGTTTYDETSNNLDLSFSGNVTWTSGHVPDAHNQAEGGYTLDLDTNETAFDIDGQSNVSTTLSGALSVGATSITVSSTTGFPASGVGYIDGDKFTYSGTSGGNTFTGVPASGNDAVLGHPTGSVLSSMNRFNPFFKARNFRDPSTLPAAILESSTLTDVTDYQLHLKPYSTSYFAQDILYYSTLQSSTTNIGSDLTGNDCVVVDARYGSGIECNASGENADFTSTSNIDYAKGAIEFWVSPATASADGVERTYLNQLSGSDQLRLRKTSGNTLEFLIHDGTNSSTESVSSSNYAWEAGDWVHIRLEWDDSASAADAQKLFINGVEPTHTDGNTDWVGANVSPGTTFYLGNDAAAGTVHCNCILDEFYIYDYNGSGDRAESKRLSEGGDTDDSDEYLADLSNDYTFDFNDDDSANRGEYIYLGSDNQFQGININLATVGAGSSLDFDWEYWNGISWGALTVSEIGTGSAQFTADGTAYFTAPGDWFPYSYNSSPELYYVRGHLEGGTYSTDPIEDGIRTDILLFQYNSNISANDQTFELTQASNSAPDSPTSLSQKETDDTVIVVADWIDDTSVKFTASASDTDNPDTLYLCIEADQLGTGFSNTEDSCGSGVAYSGSPVTVTHTLTGLTQGAEYHWQARVKDTAGAYSSWVSFSTNTENDRDFGIDNTGPSTGTVYDGEVIATDADENDGDLSELFANWSGIADTQSKLEKYQYAIGTTAGATDILTWTDKAEPGTLFSNGFESGDLTAWNSSSIDSGDLAANSGAQYFGLYGAKATLDDTTAIYVQDDFTAAGDYYSRIYLNPNSLTMTSGDTFDLVDVRSTTTSRATLQLNYDGANYRVRGVLAVGPQNTAWVNISASAWTSVEMRWFANTSGLVSIWVDGVQYNTATGNTSSTTVDNVRIGAVAGIDATTTGSFYFDNFTSGATYLGQLNYIDQTIAASGHLHTGQQYFFSVRGVNNAGTTAGTTNSDGLQVLPTLSFAISTSSLTFLNLNSSNSWTDSQSLTTTTSTNGYGGYTISMWSTQPLTNLFDGAYTISNYSGTNASPTSWTGTGFGYTTSDSNLGGGTANRFTNGGAKYAGLVNSGSGDPVADHTDAVTGTTGPISAQQFNLTYRITSTGNQAAGPYGTSIILIATPNF